MESLKKTLEDHKPGKIVVQCPTCQTKFAVEGDVVAQHESPRFHCSRCDSVFTLEESRIGAHSSTQAEQLSLGDMRGAATSPPTAAAKHPALGLEIPKSVSAATVTAPHENISNEEEPDLLEDLSPEEQIEFGFAKQYEARTRSDYDDFSLEGAEPDYRSQLEPNYAEFAEQGQSLAQALSVENTRIVGSWKGFLVLIAPLSIFILTLVFVGLFLGSNHETGRDVLRAVSGPVPETPPSGLVIKNAKYRPVVLHDGEKIGVIYGRLENGSGYKLSNIILEGLLFNSLGSPVSQIRTDAASTVKGARVKSLSSDIIRELQAVKDAEFTLAPGESKDFALALLDGAIENGSFYTVRIYSVEIK